MLKEISNIELTEEIWLNRDCVGYCAEAGQYLFAKQRGYMASYYDYYLISREQYTFIQSHAEDIEKNILP